MDFIGLHEFMWPTTVAAWHASPHVITFFFPPLLTAAQLLFVSVDYSKAKVPYQTAAEP